MNPTLPNPGGREDGAALLIGLVLLIVLSIVAMVAMQLVSNQNRVAANAWGAQMSLATGEGALGTAETALLNGAITEDFALNANGAYTFDWYAVPQWAQSTFVWNGSDVLAGAAYQNSQYPRSTAEVIAEQLPAVAAPGQSLCASSYGCNGGTLQVFRVTARAIGPDGKMPVLLQDTSVH